MKPHFFIYEILKRKVVRRFMPMLDSFKQDWDTAENFRAGHEKFQFAATKGGSLINPHDSDLDGTSNDENGAEDYVEDVSVFEVSPQGNFLVAFISNEFLTLKMLPRSSTPQFRKLLTPSFMIQEHISMSIDQEILSYSMEEAQKEQKHHVYEKDQDKNLFVVTKENIQQTSMSSDNATSKSIAEQLIHAF